MPLVNEPKHIYEPNPLACGQAVLAMLSGEDVENVIKLVGTDRETKLKDMFSALEHYGIEYERQRKEAKEKSDLADICILSLETPKCWHWSLYFKGTFYDPEYGVLSDFPPSNRRYFFEIKEKPSRKPNRMKGFDYSSNGMYFITLCTKERRRIFWNDVGATIGRPWEELLSSNGKIANEAIKNISKIYSAVTVENYVIMPNHIHMILQIHVGEDGRPMVAPTISTVIQQMKGYVTKKIGFPVWQKLFHDHVIRNDADYRKIYEYIESNPAKWQEDEYYQNPED